MKKILERYSRTADNKVIIDIAASEIRKEDFVIQFRFAVLTDMGLMSRIQTSIHNYFQYLKVLELRELAKMSRSSLVLFSIGVVFLFMSVLISQRIADYDGVITHVFAEGITIAAWVSVWNAITIFLINWVPRHQQFKMYERISKAKVFFMRRHRGINDTFSIPVESMKRVSCGRTLTSLSFPSCKSMLMPTRFER